MKIIRAIIISSKKVKGKSMKKLDALKLVQSHQEELQKLGVKSLNLFGSVARGQANPQSDVDILVELDESIGFFEFFHIKHYLEDLFQCPVDLGTVDALKEHLRQPILEEVVHVF
ncbi:nucleotidyltransferase family protein [Leptothermofonsia sichuanensis]|uniref:nucleotidyltransferase family protein n=1 Tax=Leptothermofonsia sichuanensis TaxID=2917832 RepID=UPI001EEF7917